MKKSFRCIFTAAAFFIMITFPGCAGKPAPLETQNFAAGNFGNYLSPEGEELVRTGIRYHDQGDYQNALNYYNQAMEHDPNHPVILYEMGYSYISMGNYNAAVEMADKGIAEAKNKGYAEVIPSLLDLKGSALDNMGRSEDAINVYLEAINVYGVSNTFIYYNLAVSYYRIERREDAVKALTYGLTINANHASSNYLMGKICMEDGKKTQAFYSLCYFLLLEPNTERATQSYNTILYMLRQEEMIGVSDKGAFTASDMIISVAFALDDENFRLSDAEKTKAKLYYIITNLDDMKNSGKIQRSNGDELWWDFYSPFFNRIAVSDYFGIFCRYIGFSSDPDAGDWIENGRDEIEGFFEWLNEPVE
ncbi:MAG: tetratricopeptide repeat protein [Treponema sp.]|nr:tetratricopeptide repeat protein [Treponema sp.]